MTRTVSTDQGDPMTKPWRLRASTALLTLPLAASGLLAPATAAPSGAGDRIDLPTGWQPEGVTTDGTDLYVGSLADGRILRADLRNGRTTVLSKSETGKPAVGIDYDRWRDVIWVAGGPEGEIRAQSASNGRVIATYRMPRRDGRFINDVVVTRKAVYATDSMKQQLGVVRIADGEIPPSGKATKLRLTGDLQYEDGFNANGIVRSGRWLVLVQSNTGTLFRVNKSTGRTRAIDAGSYEFSNGDGLERDGKRGLHVVRNQDNLVVDVRLSPRRLKAKVLEEHTSANLDVPTTVADVGASLWAVNARFGNAAPTTADYWITRLPDPRG
jgi:sugar lactone lactonase YvrE